MNLQGAQFVFGYGSLTAWPGSGAVFSRELRAHGFVADLVGLRRTWGVAMDNRRDLPGYKYYTGAEGRRPRVFVAYLDLVGTHDDPAAGVNGLCLPVDDALLAALDRRERNYQRAEVSDRVAVAGGGELAGVRVWAYIGSPAARERLAEGRATGTAVIDAGYLRAVEAGFVVLGDDELAAARPSLEPSGLAVIELTRHELP